MILDRAFVVIQEFDPSTLTHVQLLLLEDMLETPVIGVNGALGTVQVMSPYLKRENNCSQFQIVCSVVPFVNLKLARCVGNDLVTLHQHTTKSLDGSIAVNHKIVCAFRQ
ncbi:hypothetical protein HanRHA438_Chr13g0605521 [Helianthus annuus]|nr:hypothetical protein HanRHA438_Chr13g0605521 [Helianthus annuus]